MGVRKCLRVEQWTEGEFLKFRRVSVDNWKDKRGVGVGWEFPRK